MNARTEPIADAAILHDMIDIADLQKLEVVEPTRSTCCQASHPVTYHESIFTTFK